MDSQEVERLKRQIISQVEKTFPEDKKEAVMGQIESMTDGQFMEFLERNSLAKGEECIFCAIATGKMRSRKIGENEKAVAVLEINPVSKGHTLIIPKEHISSENIPKEAYSLMDSTSVKIKEKLSPKGFDISPADFGEHGVINIIPVYSNENINSGRHRAENSELGEIEKLLLEENPEGHKKAKNPEAKPGMKKSKSGRSGKEKQEDGKLWLPKRIP